VTLTENHWASEITTLQCIDDLCKTEETRFDAVRESELSGDI